jgi:hypothetical protein
VHIDMDVLDPQEVIGHGLKAAKIYVNKCVYL